MAAVVKEIEKKKRKYLAHTSALFHLKAGILNIFYWFNFKCKLFIFLSFLRWFHNFLLADINPKPQSQNMFCFLTFVSRACNV